MELHKLKNEELKALDSAKLRETDKDIRRQLVDIRMDIYSAQNKHTGKIRGLRKALARVLTAQHASSLAAGGLTKVKKPSQAGSSKAAGTKTKAKSSAATKKAAVTQK